jgi:deoxyxylulose-5-phosphate synthase
VAVIQRQQSCRGEASVYAGLAKIPFHPFFDRDAIVMSRANESKTFDSQQKNVKVRLPVRRCAQIDADGRAKAGFRDLDRRVVMALQR